MTSLIPVFTIALISLSVLLASPARAGGADSPKSIYDFTVKNIDGKDVKLTDYSGKVLMIVNLASQ